MKKNIKKSELQKGMLTLEQCSVMRSAIVNGILRPFTDQNLKPSDAIYKVASDIADEIIKEAQMALMQGNVFDNILKIIKIPTKKVKKSSKKIVLPKNFGKKKSKK